MRYITYFVITGIVLCWPQFVAAQRETNKDKLDIAKLIKDLANPSRMVSETALGVLVERAGIGAIDELIRAYLKHDDKTRAKVTLVFDRLPQRVQSLLTPHGKKTRDDRGKVAKEGT